MCLPPRPRPSSIHKLRENVFQEHQTLKEKELETGPRASHGYGGKFGVEQDRMDKVGGGGACGSRRARGWRARCPGLLAESFEAAVEVGLSSMRSPSS